MHCFQFQRIILKAQKKVTNFVHNKIMSRCHWLRYNTVKQLTELQGCHTFHESFSVYYCQNCLIKPLLCAAIYLYTGKFHGNLLKLFTSRTIFRRSRNMLGLLTPVLWGREPVNLATLDVGSGFIISTFPYTILSQNCSKFMRRCQARKSHETSIPKENYPFILTLRRKGETELNTNKYLRFTRNAKVKSKSFP